MSYVQSTIASGSSDQGLAGAVNLPMNWETTRMFAMAGVKLTR